MKRQYKRLLFGSALLCLLIGLLALASFMSQESWEGGFPPGQFRVTIKDEDGAPINTVRHDSYCSVPKGLIGRWNGR